MISGVWLAAEAYQFGLDIYLHIRPECPEKH